MEPTKYIDSLALTCRPNIDIRITLHFSYPQVGFFDTIIDVDYQNQAFTYKLVQRTFDFLNDLVLLLSIPYSVNNTYFVSKIFQSPFTSDKKTHPQPNKKKKKKH